MRICISEIGSRVLDTADPAYPTTRLSLETRATLSIHVAACPPLKGVIAYGKLTAFSSNKRCTLSQ
eukprot:1667062-Ditylum_brightwellii.AAC.1